VSERARLTSLYNQQGRWLKVFHLSGRVAPIIISPISGVIYHYVDPDASWVASYLLLCFSMILAIVLYKLLFQDEKRSEVNMRDDALSLPQASGGFASTSDALLSDDNDAQAAAVAARQHSPWVATGNRSRGGTIAGASLGRSRSLRADEVHQRLQVLQDDSGDRSDAYMYGDDVESPLGIGARHRIHSGLLQHDALTDDDFGNDDDATIDDEQLDVWLQRM
jgi:hypothetical protein